MKLLLYILCIAALASGSHVQIFAATPASPSATTTVKTDQIDALKVRLATKVAQMNQVMPKAVFGTVKTVSTASMTVETPTKDLKIELTDDIQVFQTVKGKRTSLTIDNIDKGDSVAIIGDFDVTLEVLRAKKIFIQNQIPVRIYGFIKNTDAKQYTINIENGPTQSYTIDFETTSKAFEWAGSDGESKIGFSKLTAGDFISVLGYPVPKKENRISASRILVIHTQAPVTPTASPEPTVKPSPTPKPTTKSAAPKATPTTEP